MIVANAYVVVKTSIVLSDRFVVVWITIPMKIKIVATKNNLFYKKSINHVFTSSIEIN